MKPSSGSSGRYHASARNRGVPDDAAGAATAGAGGDVVDRGSPAAVSSGAMAPGAARLVSRGDGLVAAALGGAAEGVGSADGRDPVSGGATSGVEEDEGAALDDAGPGLSSRRNTTIIPDTRMTATTAAITSLLRPPKSVAMA